LILGTWNYPLFLAGVQAAQALAAGNQVLIKPAPGCESATQQLADCFVAAGVPEEQMRVLGSDVASATEAIDAGVDLIVLTGSANTGRRVMEAAAKRLTPCILELSGCDAMIVLPGADCKRVRDAVGFGLRFNQGATCIGPRRIFVPTGEITAWQTRLGELFRSDPPMRLHPAAAASVQEMLGSALAAGAQNVVGGIEKATDVSDGDTLTPTVLTDVPNAHPILEADLFAPIASLIPWDSIETLTRAIHQCPYRLSASIFGPANTAESLSRKIDAGSVVINDLIAPTADPRLSFGGCGESGFGVTRGPEGLLAMTRPQNTIRRRGRIAPHLSPRNDSDVELLTGLLQWQHQAGFQARWRGLKRLIAATRGESRSTPD
ncbi:MAG: aldehyde dehydrogenase family protein, partial [Planctomycetota bacterium]